jgi:uncharacterized membrane protein (UPF0136 family)
MALLRSLGGANSTSGKADELRRDIRRAMINSAMVVFGVFGVFSVAGGVIGFKKAGSKASLIAGGVCGALLLGAAGCLAGGLTGVGLLLGGGTSALLAGRFVPAYLKTRKLMPQGVMAGLSALGLLLTLVTYVLG